MEEIVDALWNFVQGNRFAVKRARKQTAEADPEAVAVVLGRARIDKSAEQIFTEVEIVRREEEMKDTSVVKWRTFRQKQISKLSKTGKSRKEIEEEERVRWVGKMRKARSYKTRAARETKRRMRTHPQ